MSCVFPAVTAEDGSKGIQYFMEVRMRSTRIVTLTLMAVLLLPQLTKAQDITRPERIDALFNTMIGEWEGMMTLTWSGGTVQKIPMTCDCEPVLDTTAISCMLRLMFNNDYTIGVIQIYSWDAMVKKFVLYEAADNGEVSYSEAVLPSVPSDPFHMKMLPKTLDGVEHTATTDFSAHGKNELRYLVDYQKNGKLEINQVIKLTRK